MPRLHSADPGWSDTSSQLISSRLEQGARHIAPLNASQDSASSSFGSSSSSSSRSLDSSLRNTSATSRPEPTSRLERAESFMSTATVASGILASATIHKLERSAASARPVRLTKSRKDAHNNLTPSSSLERISSRSTEATGSQSSPISLADHSNTTVTTSFDTTLRSPAFPTAKTQSPHHSIAPDLVEPKSFFSDSFSADDSTRSHNAPTSRLASFSSEALSVASVSRRGSDQSTNDMGATDLQASEMSNSSSYQSAISSLPHSVEHNAAHARTRPPATAAPASASRASNVARFGLGIQTRGPPATSYATQHTPGPSLEVVLEARESPYLGSRASQGTSTPLVGGPSQPLTISTSLPPSSEPVWGESYSDLHSNNPDPMAGSLATFSFPSPAPSSAFPASISKEQTVDSSLSARRPSRSPASAFHSSNPSIQSIPSNVHANPVSTYKQSEPGFLNASGWNHAPPSSYAGSVISSVGGAPSTFGLSQLGPANRDDMLQRLILDQARVDCQDYGTMSLEQVAEAKRELKHVERKVQSLRSKLKVEIKIRDAAVALRKAHRRTAASAHSPTSSISLAVSPTSPGFSSAPAPSSSAAPLSATSSSFSFAARSRAVSVSASEAKAEEDVVLATAKVDKVANELFKWTERASWLRRKILEHQAATLSERVVHLESDRQVIEEKLPFLTASASFESLAPSASASAVGLSRYREGGHRYQPSDEPYIPRGPQDPLRHNRLESDLSAISGFSFLDASGPEKLRRLGEELERKREVVRKLEQDLSTSRDTAQRREETSGRLTQQLEEQSRERASAAEELRVLREQLRAHEETARQAQISAVRSAVADVEQRMHKQLDQSRSRDQEKEDALVNAKAESMAGQRALAELQSRLDAQNDEVKALRTRAEAAERATEDHKRKVADVQNESSRQLSQGTMGLASLQADLQAARTAQDAASALASSRAEAIAELEKALEKVQTELGTEKKARVGAEQQISEAQKQVTDTRSKAVEADNKLRELELAVGAERRIMAERDELFHAFERRLESAERRLQECDKRCARMLGKLEGREEMDDLLEMIKKGSSGVAKKTKTAGQDIAGLLSNLETHLGDLELELARANTHDSARDSIATSDASAPTEKGGDKGVTNGASAASADAEIGQLRSEVERLQALVASQPEPQPGPSSEDLKKLRGLEDEVRNLTEKNDSCKRQGEERATRLEGEVRTLAEQIQSLERQKREEVEQLEAKLGALEGQKRELEKRVQSASIVSSPAASTDAMPMRMSKGVSPLVSTVPLPKKGVGNLIDRFGGGRKVSSEMRGDDEPAILQACLRSVETLRAMLPDLSAAAKGSADLHALREAFEPRDALPSPTAARSPSSGRTPLGAGELQAELEAATERLRSTMAVSRAVIDLALESEGGKQSRADADKASNEAASQAQNEDASMQQALVARVSSLTAKVKEQAEREGRLKAELVEAREQLEVARSTLRAPPSPLGLTPASDSMLGLSTSPAKAGEALAFSLPKSLGRVGSNRSMRTLGDKASPRAVSALQLPGSGSLAPMRSASALDMVPSPTRSNYSAVSSPSIRYISPFSAPGSDARAHAKTPEPRAEGGVGNVSLGDGCAPGEASDSTSLRSGSSPSSTQLGLPSSATSVAGMSQTSFSLPRAAAEAGSASGMIKRTITLGMDVPQLVSRVRELERQLAHTASIRQRAERVGELETQLREANHAYARLIDRMDAERRSDAEKKVHILNELTDAQSRLCTTQRQAVSPLASPLLAPRPIPPPKD